MHYVTRTLLAVEKCPGRSQRQICGNIYCQVTIKDTYNQLKDEERNGSTTGGETKNSITQHQQSTITAAYDSRRPFAPDDPRANHITKPNAEMIVLNDLLFNFINNKGF